MSPVNSPPPFIGVLMLDTQFKRITGDVGHPDTFSFPVRYKVVEGATTGAIVKTEKPDQALINRFIDAARSLENEGAVGLISSCGFLSVLQNEIAGAVDIPVVLSSLNLIPTLQLSLGHDAVGVITADKTRLSTQAFCAVNIDPRWISVAGMQASKAFVDYIFKSSVSVPDKQRLSQDLIACASQLCDENPNISVLVLECTNLQPYAAELNQALKLPVVGIVNAANMLWDISLPRRFC